MDPAAVSVQVQRVDCQATKDGLGAAEPYLWTIFFKIDGDTASVDDSLTLQGTATVLAPPVARDNLCERGKGLSAGDSVSVSSTLGEYRTLLTPIPLTTPFLDQSAVAGGIGCVVALLEHDSSREQDIAQAHASLTKAIQTTLNTIIPTLNFSTREIKAGTSEAGHKQICAAIKQAVQNTRNGWQQHDSWRNDDDVIGIGVWYCAANEVATAGANGCRFAEHWDIAGAWTIIGQIAIGTPPADQTAKG